MSGIAYLHKCKIIHRDIKCSNILMNSKGDICIGDFGLARRDNQDYNKRYTQTVVTLCYRAPEILLGSREYGPAVDIWSAGCVFAELLTGNILFSRNDKEKDQIDKIFSICGTPNDKTWPGISQLPKYKSLQKTDYKNSLRECFKDNKNVDDATFDLINKLLELNKRYVDLCMFVENMNFDDFINYISNLNQEIKNQNESVEDIAQQIYMQETYHFLVFLHRLLKF